MTEAVCPPFSFGGRMRFQERIGALAESWSIPRVPASAYPNPRAFR